MRNAMGEAFPADSACVKNFTVSVELESAAPCSVDF